MTTFVIQQKGFSKTNPPYKVEIPLYHKPSDPTTLNKNERRAPLEVCVDLNFLAAAGNLNFAPLLAGLWCNGHLAQTKRYNGGPKNKIGMNSRSRVLFAGCGGIPSRPRWHGTRETPAI